MNRLPLILSTLMLGFAFVVSSPFLIVIWLLGGKDVFANYTDNWDEIL